jgi:hypothetical protein
VEESRFGTREVVRDEATGIRISCPNKLEIEEHLALSTGTLQKWESE